MVELLTIQEVAIYSRVSRTTVWRWCQQGVIPACQVGQSWRIIRDQLLELATPFPDAYYVEDDGRPVSSNDGGQPLAGLPRAEHQTIETLADGFDSEEDKLSGESQKRGSSDGFH